MQRIVQGRSATLSYTFYSDGVATDPSPDNATVTITRADGTVLVNAAAATEAGVGKVTYTVTPTQTALLDRWTVTWTATFGGQSQTFTEVVEVAGGVLFTLAQARKRSPLSDTTTYSSADILDARTWAEQMIEDECGTAFVPRYELETLSGEDRGRLEVKWSNVRVIRAVAMSFLNETPYTFTSTDISALRIANDLRYIERIAGWYPGWGNILIGYEHGLDSAPAAIANAALELARYKLVSDAGSGSVDPRAERIITEDGTLVLGVAGVNGRFGIPSVDAAVSAYSTSGIY